MEPREPTGLASFLFDRIQHNPASHPPDITLAMAARSTEIRLFHGEALFRLGQRATHFYMVKSGTIYVLDERGSVALKQFFTGELFGIPEVLARAEWTNTAIAFGITRLVCFDASHLFQSLDEMPQSQSDFIKHLATLA